VKDDPARDATIAEIDQLTGAMEQAAEAAKAITSRLAKIAQHSAQIIDEMDFNFLLDPERKVFTIGYNVSEGKQDNSFTTCWRLKHAWPASSRSPRATCRRNTGSAWAGS